jgi:calcium/calmodulin-dependent protein kinase I
MFTKYKNKIRSRSSSPGSTASFDDSSHSVQPIKATTIPSLYPIVHNLGDNGSPSPVRISFSAFADGGNSQHDFSLKLLPSVPKFSAAKTTPMEKSKCHLRCSSAADAAKPILTQHRRTVSEGTNSIDQPTMSLEENDTANFSERNVDFQDLYVLTREVRLIVLKENLYLILLGICQLLPCHLPPLVQIFKSQRSSIWECVHREEGQRYCVKIFEGRQNTDEIAMLQASQLHRNIIPIHQVIESSSSTSGRKTCMILELMNNGNLLSRVIQQGPLEEHTVRILTEQLASALSHLHNTQNMSHNNLHPSNILLDGSDDSVKLCDFGAAVFTNDGASIPLRKNFVFHAPEGHASAAADMWSLGVVVFFCLFGHEVTFKVKHVDLLQSIHFDPPAGWNKISRQAKQFLTALLHIDPGSRLTADDALQHPWQTQANGRTTDECPTSTSCGGNRRHHRYSFVKSISRISALYCLSRMSYLRRCNSDSAAVFPSNL